uniref:C-type lectin domain-containing protein n=1 Tax=Pundamilia nyererei TaxID=303518 RepID=A0A3B4HCE8_9CICH
LQVKSTTAQNDLSGSGSAGALSSLFTASIFLKSPLTLQAVFYPSKISSCNLFKDEPCYKCEDDWKEHGGNCYYFSTNSSSWNESRTVCKTKGGDLVKIDSEEEQV